MRAIVLGGTGFVGRHVCEALAAAGDEVVAVSRTSPHPVDIAAPDGARRLGRLFAREGADLVVNAAGRPCHSADQELVDGSLQIVDRLLEAACAQTRPPRVIQVGSAREYGLGTVGTAYPEDGPASPITAYGRSKLRATQTVLARADDLDVVVLRVSNACGAGMPRGSLLRTVADHLARAAEDHARGERPQPLRFGSLRAWHDFVDARDVAGAVVAAAHAPAVVVRGEIINVGRGEAIHVRGLVDRLVELSGLPVAVGESEGGDVEWQQLDIAKAARVLGWRPLRPLEESLRDLLPGNLSPLSA